MYKYCRNKTIHKTYKNFTDNCKIYKTYLPLFSIFALFGALISVSTWGGIDKPVETITGKNIIVKTLKNMYKLKTILIKCIKTSRIIIITIIN